MSKLYLTEKAHYEKILEDSETKYEREKNAPPELKVPWTIADLENQYTQTKLTYETWLNNQKVQTKEKLKADIYIDPSYVARVKVGNAVKIKFPGLPPSRYGMIETNINLLPPDVTYISGSAVFIAEAEIENPYLVTKKNQTAKLLSGITAEGRVITDRSTVMQMVLRKLDFVN